MEFQEWLKAHYVKTGFISSTDELRAAWDAAVAAERERWARVRELASQCAEWHIGDSNGCGEIARELYELLRPNGR